MRRLPRRLALWGGAAAIAGGGFAFMASNVLTASGAGEGSAPVTGYTVSNVTYNTASGYGCGGTTACYIHTVQFTLATRALKPSQAYTAPPKFVRAALDGASGQFLANTTCAPSSPWATGMGHFTCTVTGTVTNTGFVTNSVRVKNVHHLDVTATQ